MTGKTGLLLCQGIENPVAFSVDLMAGCTGNIFTLVSAAKPAQAAPGYMTAQAYPVLFGRRRCSFKAEGKRWIAVPTPALTAGMLLAGPMAGFALKIRERCLRIGLRCVFGVEYRSGRLF